MGRKGEQNARGRYVYLPEEMKFIKFMPDGTIFEEVLAKGDPYYNPNLSLDASWMMKEDGYGTSCSVDVNI